MDAKPQVPRDYVLKTRHSRGAAGTCKNSCTLYFQVHGTWYKLQVDSSFLRLDQRSVQQTVTLTVSMMAWLAMTQAKVKPS